MELLVIEDDPLIGKALRKGFSESGHNCIWVKEGLRGSELASGQQVDAIVLDLMLPGRSGLEVLTELRASGIRTPLIVLTALAAVDDRVAALNAGAYANVVKPIEL